MLIDVGVLQRLADAAANGFFSGPVDAKIQGPYDGHDMAGYEIDTYTCKLVLCGGVGIAAVLPMLKRMSLHIEGSNQVEGTLHTKSLFAAASYMLPYEPLPFVSNSPVPTTFKNICSFLPQLDDISVVSTNAAVSSLPQMHAVKAQREKIVVVHSARTVSEVVLAAPLLKHASVLDLRVHYTGDWKELQSTQQTLPAPLPTDASSKRNEWSASGMPSSQITLVLGTIYSITRSPTPPPPRYMMGVLFPSSAPSSSVAVKFNFSMHSISSWNKNMNVQAIGSVLFCVAGKDIEGGGSSGCMHNFASFFTMRAVPGKWEALFVWTLSYFFGFWTLVRSSEICRASCTSNCQSFAL